MKGGREEEVIYGVKKLIDFRAGNSVAKVRVLGMLDRTTMQVRKQFFNQ